MEDVAALRQHLRGCDAAQQRLQGVDGGPQSCRTPQALLEAGYLPSGPGGVTAQEGARFEGNKGADELAEGSRRLEWGRRAGTSRVSRASVGEAERRTQAGGSDQRWSMGPPAMADAMEGLDEAGAEAGVSARMGTAEQAEDAEQDKADQLALLRKRAQAEGMRREHWCSVCGKTFMLTPTEILQHRRSHSI